MQNILFLIFYTFFLFAGCANDSSASPAQEKKSKSIAQELSFQDSNKIIYNPDMGFYCLQGIAVTTEGISNLSDIQNAANNGTSKLDSEGNYSSSAQFDLVHLEFDISAFSGRVNKKGDILLSDTPHALEDIKTVLGYYRSAEKNVIVRFAYDPNYSGKSENGKYVEIEPNEWDTVISNTKSLCPILKEYSDIITAVECGMLGPWGEMHSTYFAEGKLNGKLRGYTVDLIKTFLSELKGTKLPLLVRQPQFIYCYLTDDTTYDGSYIPNKPSFSDSDDIYRLGIYNDGYLDGESDSGTFRTNDGRDAEIAFLEGFTNHTPYGGEMIGTYGLESGVTQLKNVHLSFLNIGWNQEVFKKLDSSDYTYGGEKMFKYLLKHMGYRYVLTSSTFDYYENQNQIGIRLEFRNDGFASLPYHRKKAVKLYFVPKDTKITGSEQCIDVKEGTFCGQENLSLKADISCLASGTYDVYAKLCDSDGKFPIQLANDLWNEKLRANKIGSFEK